MQAPLKIGIALFLTLVIGIAIGVFGSGLIMGYLDKRIENRPVDQRIDFFIERMYRKLDIDEATRAEVDPILRAHMRRMDTLNQGHRQEVDAELDSLRTELQSLLTPEQMERLGRLQQRVRGHGGHGFGGPRGHRGRRGPQPPPPQGQQTP